MASAGPYASVHLAPDRLPCQHPTSQSFLQAGSALPAAQPTASKSWKQAMQYKKKYKNQPGMNLTPSQSCHVVRWHCTTESKWRVGEINYYYYYYHNKQLTSITSTLPHYQFRAGTDGHSRASFTPDVSTRPMGRPRCPRGAWGVPRTRTWRSIYEWWTHIQVTSTIWTVTYTSLYLQ